MRNKINRIAFFKLIKLRRMCVMNNIKNLRFFLSACLLAMAVLFSGVAQAHEEDRKSVV